jgi:hypothetical protein
MGKHHGQGQQQIGHGGCLLLIATVGSVEGLLQVIQHLPDPRGRPDGATEKGQCGIEQRPGYAFESLPAILRIGQRLPLRHFNQRIDVGSTRWPGKRR